MAGISGKRILVTRSSEQAEETGRAISILGGIPVLFPCLKFCDRPHEVDRGLDHLRQRGTEALFTSANAVRAVNKRLGKGFASFFREIPVAAVGERTCALLEAMGVSPRLVPETASQEGLLTTYEQRGLPERLVFFRSLSGRDWLKKALSNRGVTVHMAHVYESACPDDDASRIIHSLTAGEIDAVLLGSSQTAVNYIRRIGDLPTAGRPIIAVISANVARTAREHGLDVQVVAEKASFESMLTGLQAFFDQSGLNHGEALHANHGPD